MCGSMLFIFSMLDEMKRMGGHRKKYPNAPEKIKSKAQELFSWGVTTGVNGWAPSVLWALLAMQGTVGT